MSSVVTSSVRRSNDHFEPEASLDPQEQRRLRGHLEKIDFAAYGANREVLAKAIGHTSIDKFERLACAAAEARATWVKTAMAFTEKPGAITAEQAQHLASLRQSFEELTEVYEAMRRMVERGYLPYQGK